MATGRARAAQPTSTSARSTSSSCSTGSTTRRESRSSLADVPGRRSAPAAAQAEERRLDSAVAQIRGGDADRERQGEQAERRAGLPRGVPDRLQDRHVPEVVAVGDDAEEGEHAPFEQAYEWAAPKREDARREEEGRRHGRQVAVRVVVEHEQPEER